MKRRSGQIEIFTLSFLDCITCGFGAVILLLILSDFGEPQALEKAQQHLEGRLVKLEEELHEIRGETELLNRELPGRVDLLEREKMKLARLSGDLTDVRGEFSASRTDASAANIIEAELVAAYQTLTKEMQRLLRERRNRPRTEAVGGIPIDSEYVIFVIDTSGSMTGNHWDAATQVMQEILDIYPRVRGLQIMNDNGKHMFESTRGQWLEDSASRRKDIVRQMKSWRAFSDSNPVDGISDAIRTYWAPDKRVSIYLLGDEFTGDSIQAALDAVTAVNKPDSSGRRRVRIHAIGFPEGPRDPPFTNIRFSALMRLMCEQNNGTFVGVTG
ncbi:MAG: VWA domain-containing protein [Steroidobacteraceae bacterium]